MFGEKIEDPKEQVAEVSSVERKLILLGRWLGMGALEIGWGAMVFDVVLCAWVLRR
jgi:hypothetical protein